LKRIQIILSLIYFEFLFGALDNSLGQSNVSPTVILHSFYFLLPNSAKSLP